jgi:hypothetical protein
MLGHTDEKYIAAWCATELFSYSEKTDLIEAKLMVYASLIVAAKNELLDISMLGTMGDKLGDIFLSDERDAITELLEEYFLADEAFEFIIEELIASAKIIDDDEYIATALTTALENEEISDSNKELVKNALFSFLNGKGFEATEVPGFNEITGSEVTDQPTYIDSVGTLNWESLIMDNTVAFPGSKKETTEE